MDSFKEYSLKIAQGLAVTIATFFVVSNFKDCIWYNIKGMLSSHIYMSMLTTDCLIVLVAAFCLFLWALNDCPSFVEDSKTKEKKIYCNGLSNIIIKIIYYLCFIGGLVVLLCLIKNGNSILFSGIVTMLTIVIVLAIILYNLNTPGYSFKKIDAENIARTIILAIFIILIWTIKYIPLLGFCAPNLNVMDILIKIISVITLLLVMTGLYDSLVNISKDVDFKKYNKYKDELY